MKSTNQELSDKKCKFKNVDPNVAFRENSIETVQNLIKY